MERYICVHGHFYQPPRENPWLEDIEYQDSAYPYHDWNERITAECYEPNAAARILGEEDRIVRIVNNYAKISFNFGPTLLAWLEEKAPHVYQAILQADIISQKLFSGHGSAVAQAYNHMILPLANRRDKYTQVLWGIHDFERRFGRKPEGMWLPETATDLESLDILAELGMRFTVLAPHQAWRTRRISGWDWRDLVRRISGWDWRDVSGARIDPTTPYLLQLPSGRNLSLFFYDRPISHAAAFEGLLNNGEHFASRLLGAFSDARPWPQLIHIATDGETYGHHHRHGDMALAYALHYIESKALCRLTNYGEFLEKHPLEHEVQICENTSWSCAHGIGRWKSDCGCNSGSHPGWNQAWRASLREALDWLRDTLAVTFEEKGRELLKDPWAARNDYIAVILDRSPETIERFLSEHAVRDLNQCEKVTVLKLMELQRHAMLMYTSCGWFFDDLSGIETIQVIQYAGRAVQLAQKLFGDSTEIRFLEMLERAKSNVPEYRDGRLIYERFVRPAVVDWEKIGAHYAISSLFETYPERVRVYCYTAQREDTQSFEAGRLKLLMGRANLSSDVTLESKTLSYGVLHFGDHTVNGGVRIFQGEDAYIAMVDEISECFSTGDFPGVIRLMDSHFGESTYSLKSLFRDEQRKILDRILESVMAEAESVYCQLYERHVPMMHFLADLGIPPAKAFYAAAEFVLNAYLRRAFESQEFNTKRIQTLLEEARHENVALDVATLSYALKSTMERLADRLSASPTDRTLLGQLEAAATLACSLPFEVDLRKVQNSYYGTLRSVYNGLREKAKKGDEAAGVWILQFTSLGEKLSIRVD